MPKRHHAAHATTHQRHRLSQREKHEHKQRVLTHGAPSVTGSIAGAVVVKNGNLFFLADSAGIVPLGGNHGFGLYYHDCPYLSGYDLKLAGANPLCLVSTAEKGYLATFQLTNPDIRMSGGALIVGSAYADLRFERAADGTIAFRVMRIDGRLEVVGDGSVL